MAPRVPAEPHSAAGHTVGAQRTSAGGPHKATSPAVPGANHSPGRGQAGAPPLKKTIRWSLVRSYTASTRSSCSGRPRQKRCTCAGCRDTSCRSRVSRQKYLPGGTDGAAAGGGLGPLPCHPPRARDPRGLPLKKKASPRIWATASKCVLHRWGSSFRGLGTERAHGPGSPPSEPPREPPRHACGSEMHDSCVEREKSALK